MKENFEYNFEPIEDTIIVDKVKDGYIVKYLIQDETPDTPREWGTLGTMLCGHRRYELGDKQTKDVSDNFTSWDDIEEYIRQEEDIAVLLPLYLYDHSGITIRTYPFERRWDSGQIGFIYITKDKVRKEYKVKRI